MRKVSIYDLQSAILRLRSGQVYNLQSAMALGLAFLALYVYTAAPSVLSGDSAEFQFAAPLLGIPHPTTYPLYVLLGHLATFLFPFGDLARRVTLLSALCGALAVALFFLLARRVCRSTPAAAIGALALGFAPGLWNAATMAEVYALLMALLAALACLLAPPLPSLAAGRLRLAAFVAGLGATHHALFVIGGLPLLAGAVAWLLACERSREHIVRPLAILALCFALGLTPWLFPLAQYARYGPFNGMDYGLPRHYFWGSPQSWAEVFDLISGGAVRREALRLPSAQEALAVLRMAGGRLWFEFGPLGLALGALGCVALLRRSLAAWLGAAWVILATLAYLLLLGPAVADAPIFTLPMLLPWALWIAVGSGVRGQHDTQNSKFKIQNSTPIILALLLAATLGWGYTRLPHTSKRQLWLFRRFGEATLTRLPPGAAVLAHWEQGATLQYLVLAERARPDVWIDIVEPGDVPWGLRAQRYAGRPVFFVGSPTDVAGLPVELVREDDYAALFRLIQDGKGGSERGAAPSETPIPDCKGPTEPCLSKKGT